MCAAAIPGEPKVVDLETLDPKEACDLAVALLRRSEAKHSDPAAIALEAGGHPLFIEELARHVGLGGIATEDGPTPHRGQQLRVKLDDAIWSRIVQLEPAAREMAELVAVAGKPVPQEVVAGAARVEAGEFNRRAAALRVGNLVKTGGTRWADAIEPYHDRIREAVLAQLEPKRRRALHEALAIAFEASSHDDPETLATHWREAGNGSRAAKHAAAAGDEALKAFAFDRAAQWYEQALGLSPEGPAVLRELRIKLGDALASAGRGALAAKHFEIAAAESPPMEALELRRRTAEELLRSGHFDRGMQAIRTVLAAIGMRVPTTRLGTLLSLAYYRLRIRLRGLSFREREKRQITAEQLTRVDTAHALATALGMADHAVGMVFSARTLLLALETGEIHRIVRSCAVEGSAMAAPGGPGPLAQAERFMARARELAERAGTHEARAHLAASTCMIFYANGRYREMIDEFGRMTEHIRSGSSGLVYEESSVRWFATSALAFLGRFKDLRREQALGYRDAMARGDLFASVSLRIGPAVLIWLAQDRPEVAEKHAREAMADWSKRGFHFEHYHGLVSQAYVALYNGDARAGARGRVRAPAENEALAPLVHRARAHVRAPPPRRDGARDARARDRRQGDSPPRNGRGRARDRAEGGCLGEALRDRDPRRDRASLRTPRGGDRGGGNGDARVRSGRPLGVRRRHAPSGSAAEERRDERGRDGAGSAVFPVRGDRGAREDDSGPRSWVRRRLSEGRKAGRARMARRKIAILGGGVGSLVAAYELTRTPELAARHEVTIYQMGWRLGGKGASGRNLRPGRGMRIEEHGLHVWLGFYENAFALMRAVYAERGAAPDEALPTWRDAFKPQSFTPIGEQVAGEWTYWGIDWPTNGDEPGDGKVLISPWGAFTELVNIVEKLVAQWKAAAQRAFGGEESLLERGEDLVASLLRATALVAMEPLHEAAARVRSLGCDPSAHDLEEHVAIAEHLHRFK